MLSCDSCLSLSIRTLDGGICNLLHSIFACLTIHERWHGRTAVMKDDQSWMLYSSSGTLLFTRSATVESPFQLLFYSRPQA